MSPQLARQINLFALSRAERTRLAAIEVRDAGHGYDRFGMHADCVAAAFALLKPLWRSYFRVHSVGIEHVPRTGPAVLVANHGGTIPLDAAMIWADVLWHTLRVARPVADHFVPGLPVISELYQRAGVVGGARKNVEVLLAEQELALIFPEGVPGIAKPFHRRYRLQGWRPGHAELAIRYGAPVVPVAVIGAEEQMPQIGRIPLRGAFGIPYLPIPLSPLPLPVRYHLWYGEALPLHERWRPEEADDPEVIEQAARWTRSALEALIERGLRARRGIFA